MKLLVSRCEFGFEVDSYNGCEIGITVMKLIKAVKLVSRL